MSELSGDIYHIAISAHWRAQKDSGHYQPDAFVGEGFIHCAFIQQLDGVAERYFKGVGELVILGINCNLLTVELRCENLLGASELFPHIYGPLNTDAVFFEQYCDVSPDGVIQPKPTADRDL